MLFPQEHAEEALATLQREHARSQHKMGALLESRVKSVGDLRQQLEQQITSLKLQLEASQVSHKSHSCFGYGVHVSLVKAPVGAAS